MWHQKSLGVKQSVVRTNVVWMHWPPSGHVSACLVSDPCDSSETSLHNDRCDQTCPGKTFSITSIYVETKHLEKKYFPNFKSSCIFSFVLCWVCIPNKIDTSDISKTVGDYTMEMCQKSYQEHVTIDTLCAHKEMSSCYAMGRGWRVIN